jgi:uncharacterized protein YodC (DUF2158 family)
VIKAGDVVRLVDGDGTRMTVDCVRHGRAWCCWFVGRDLHSNTYPVDRLRKDGQEEWN